MNDQPVRNLAGEARHGRSDAGEVDRHLGMVDRPGIEERRHERQPIELAAKGRSRAGLPRAPRRAKDRHVLAQLRHGPAAPGHAEAALYVRADLRAEPEPEATARQSRQVPRGRGHGRRRARESDGDRRPELQGLGRRGGRHERQEGVVTRLGGPQPGDTRGLGGTGHLGDALQRRVEAERRIEPHSVTLGQE